MKIDINSIKQQIVLGLSEDKIKIVNEASSPTETILTIDSTNNFRIEISENTITILYCDEHDDFFLQTYKNENEFIDDAVKHILKLLHNKMLIEYVYSGNIMLSYKIWIVDKETNQKSILKRVTTSLNPFLRLKQKSITIKEICFKNQ